MDAIANMILSQRGSFKDIINISQVIIPWRCVKMLCVCFSDCKSGVGCREGKSDLI